MKSFQNVPRISIKPSKKNLLQGISIKNGSIEKGELLFWPYLNMKLEFRTKFDTPLTPKYLSVMKSFQNAPRLSLKLSEKIYFKAPASKMAPYESGNFYFRHI